MSIIGKCEKGREKSCNRKETRGKIKYENSMKVKLWLLAKDEGNHGKKGCEKYLWQEVGGRTRLIFKKLEHYFLDQNINRPPEFISNN
jgi:hypothetical protein